MPLKDSLCADFDHEVATSRRLLERLPDDKLAWKPHPKSMSLGGLATHLSNLPNWTLTVLNENGFDLAEAPPNLEERRSRAEVLRLFDESCAGARKALDRTDAEYAAPWRLRRGTQEIFTLPKIAALRSFVLSHLIHHRGQLSVYLRLLDVQVPAIYGPSADEG